MSIDISKLFEHKLIPLNDIKSFKTTIRITSDGLSVFMSNEDQLAYCASFQWAQSNDLSNFNHALSNILKEEPLCNICMNNANVLLDDVGFVLVPLALFNENELESYLAHQIEDSKRAQSKAIFSIIEELVCISLINQEVFNIVQTQFQNAKIEAYNSGLLKTTSHLKTGSTDHLGIISFHGDSFDFAVKKRGQLIFFNRFKFSTKEDFIYFLMMTVQQLEIKPSAIKLTIIGKINQESPLYNLMNLYFPFIEMIKPETEVDWDYHRYFVEHKFKK